MSELPAQWMQSSIGDIAESMKNGVYKPADAYAEDGIACLRMYNVEAGKIVWRDIKRMRLSKEDFAMYRLLPGDVLVNRVNSRELVGKAAMIPNGLEPCVFESKNIRLRLLTKLVEPKFVSFKLLLDGSRHFANNAQQVVGMASISQPQLAAFPIPLPPLPEQKRIVAKIEELFSELEAGEESLRVARRQLGVYRQSLLKQAFEGKLTAKWRTQKRTQAEWRTVTLESISEDISYGYTASSTQEKIGPQLLRITDIQDNRVNWASVPFCAIEKDRKAHYLLKAGDLVFARTGATVGKSFLLKDTPPEAVFASYLIRVRCLPGNSMEYLALFFQAHTYWSQITEFSAGIGQPNVNGSKLKKLTVPLCSLPEQQEIVRVLDEQFEGIERNEREIDGALRSSEALRQAILKKAFTGRLVPQDPADEPATTLLARLRAEREAAPSPSKRRRAQIA